MPKPRRWKPVVLPPGHPQEQPPLDRECKRRNVFFFKWAPSVFLHYTWISCYSTPKIWTTPLKQWSGMSGESGLLCSLSPIFWHRPASVDPWCNIRESLTTSDGDFQGLMAPLSSFRAHVFMHMHIYHLPPEQMLQCFSSSINSKSWLPTLSAQCGCIRRGRSWDKMLTRNHFHY